MREVHLDATGADVLDEGLDEFVDRRTAVERGVDEVHTDHAQGVLLPAGVAVPEAQVQDDVARRGAGLGLETHAHPGMPLPFPVVRSRGDGVGEGEEARLRAALGRQPIDQQTVLVPHHLLEPLPGDVALGMAVDRVADAHVVGGHALRHRTRGPAGLEEMPHDLLTGADLGEDAVGRTVQVDGQRLAGGHRTGLLLGDF